MADAAGHNMPIVRKQDGTMEVHGTLDVKTATGGTFKIDGTDVSAGLQEIATIGGLTASATELNYNDGTTPGTVVASKTVAVGADKNLDTLAIADGGLKLGSGAGTAVTATAAELNLIDGSIAGTAVASKALVLGADKNVDTLAVADGGFKLGSGAGTAVTATAAELNELDDVASLAQSTVTVAAEAGDAIAVTVALKDAANVAISGARPVRAWLSDSATTGAIATDDTITVTATTGSFLVEITDDLIFDCITHTDGTLVLSVAHAGNATAKYLWVMAPGFKKPKVSAVIDLA